MDTFPKQFGLVIAYLLPGFIGLAGIAPLVPAIGTWLQPVSQGEMGFGPPIYTILAAMTVGMVISCFRWLVIDHIHLWMGVPPTVKKLDGIQDRLDAMHMLVEGHYRYYQFYSNGLVAMVFAYAIHRCRRTSPFLGLGTDLGIVIICVVLFVGSRDALTKYRKRFGQLLG